MPRYRKLHTKITISLDFNEMPDDFTRLTWALLPLAVDREGRCIDNASLVKARLFPMRDDVAPAQVNAALDWFADRGMIERYQVESRSYFWIPQFAHYQGKTEKESESELPAPPEQVESYARVSQELVKSKSRTDANADSAADANANADVDAAADTDASARGALLAAAAGPDRGNGDLEIPPECAVCLGAVARKAEVLGLKPKRARQVCLERGPRFAAMWVEEITSRRYLDARDPLEGGRQRVQNPAGLLVEMVRTGSDPPEPGASSWVWEICCASGECLPGGEGTRERETG